MKSVLGLLAIGGLMLAVLPTLSAQATSLNHPATAVSMPVQFEGAEPTEIRWRWRRHHHHWRWRYWSHHRRHNW